MAFSNLRLRKLRTFLTILAVVIGAILISLMTSISTGLEEFIVDQFGLNVSPYSISTYAGEVTYYYSYGESPLEISDSSGEVTRVFTKEDVENILAIDGVERIDWEPWITALHVSPEDSEKIYSGLIRSGPDYEINLVKLAAGDYFNEDASRICLISYDYLEIFGWEDAEDAIGRKITITIGKYDEYNTETADYNLTVCGVIEKTVNSKEIIIPISTAIDMARYYMDDPLMYSTEQPGTMLEVKVSNTELVDQVAGELNSMGFNTVTPSDILKEINNVFNVVRIGLGTFGVIALIIASIGIINTLMMSIHERTHEIGVMKAIGATKRTIRLLFMMEGTALGFIGGIIGAAAGYGVGYLLNIIGHQTFLSDYSSYQLAVFSISLFIEVVAITTVISLIAGLYPANRAAKLNTVEALSHE
jgi:putative ABC transport system permease protein